MALTLDSTTLQAVHVAMAAASTGGRATAALSAVVSAIGTGYKFKGRRDGTVVLALTYSGSLPTSGTTIVVPSSFTTVTNDAADIDSGTWTGRIESSDGSRYIEGTLGRSGTDFVLGADLDGTSTIVLSSISLSFNSNLDPPTTSLLSINDSRFTWQMTAARTLYENAVAYPGTNKMAGTGVTVSGVISDPLLIDIVSPSSPILYDNDGGIHLGSKLVDAQGGYKMQNRVYIGGKYIRYNNPDYTGGAYRSMLDADGPNQEQYSYNLGVEYVTWFTIRTVTNLVVAYPGFCTWWGVHYYGGSGPGGTFGGTWRSRQAIQAWMLPGGGSIGACWGSSESQARDHELGNALYQWTDTPFNSADHRYFIVRSRYARDSSGYHNIKERVGKGGTLTEVCNYTGQTIAVDSKLWTYPRLGIYAPADGTLNPSAYQFDTKGMGILENRAGNPGEPALTDEVILSYMDSI